jgi:NO-binding membrane sensor protein with MHYT domain
MDSPRSRPTRVLLGLLGLAFAVSVVHYTDNYVNYDDYPQPGPDDLPAPSATVIGAAWFVFTAFGVLALRLWFRGRNTGAAIALTGYSVSGLIGLGHYAVPGATGMVWWRQTHVVADILCGVAILGFALWVVARLPRTTEVDDRAAA